MNLSALMDLYIVEQMYHLMIFYYTTAKEVIYEDGTTPERWRVFGRTATGENPRDENISSIDDPQGDGSQGKVIKFQGDGLNSAYTLDINNSEYQIIQWKSRYYENYMVSIIVDTKEGLRELLYITVATTTLVRYI